MEAYYNILYVMVALITFLISMCGLLIRLGREYDEYLRALNRKNLANNNIEAQSTQLPDKEACVINLEKGCTDLDLPPKYEEVVGCGKNADIPTVHHI